MICIYKQAIAVRDDLGMGRGKIAAQSAHASIGAFKKTNGSVTASWEKEGGKKVVLMVSEEKQIKDLGKKCKELKIPFFIVKDAGLTEIPPGTTTAIGIGPDKAEKIDRVTGNLPLLE